MRRQTESTQYVLEIHSKLSTKTFLVTPCFRNGPFCKRLVKFCLEKFIISVWELVSPTCIWKSVPKIQRMLLAFSLFTTQISHTDFQTYSFKTRFHILQCTRIPSKCFRPFRFSGRNSVCIPRLLCYRVHLLVPTVLTI